VRNILINPTGVTKLVGFSNGFVKTSAGDGTLTVDTTVYETAAHAAATYQPIGSYITGSLTAGRVTLSTGATTVGDNASLTFNTGTGTLSTTRLSVNSTVFSAGS